MSVRMRHTSSHTKNRRSHHALTAETILTDKESGALRLPHRLDESTGMYRGKQIIPTATLKKREKREKEISKRVHDHDHAEGVREPMHNTPIHSEKEEKKTGVLGRLTKGRASSRSGLEG